MVRFAFGETGVFSPLFASTTHLGLAASLGLAAPTAQPTETSAEPTADPDASAPRRTRAPYRTVVRAPPDDSKRAVGWKSVVRTTDAIGATPRDGLTEVLEQSPAVRVRSLGGLGQFGSVSIRGSSPQQVAVFLDGVPIGSAMAGLVDTGEVPADGLSRVEIHRGYVPIAFGAQALGGAIDLVARRPTPGVHVEGGLGSWWTRRAAARVGFATRHGGVGLGVSYGGTVGNFPFYDDGGTPSSADDRVTRRRGNRYDRLVARASIDAKRGGWSLVFHQLANIRRAGVPGPGSSQASRVINDQLGARTVVRARRDLPRAGSRVEWLLGLGLEGRVFRDPAGEIGVGLDEQHSRTVDVFVSPRARVGLWRDAFLGVVGDVRGEAIVVDQRIERPPPLPDGDAKRGRLAAGAGIELEQLLFADRVHLVPAIRIDAVASDFAVASDGGEQDDGGRNDVAFAASPRFGARAAVLPWLVLRTSVGRYFRAPTLIELFGDRGFFVGNEGLRAEHGISVDGGFAIDTDVAGGHVSAHVAGFWIASRDLIQWISAGAVARPENIDGALVRGLESSLTVQSPDEHFDVTVHYTLLDARDRSGDPGRDGNALPGRPRHDVGARTSAGWEARARGVLLAPRVSAGVDVVARTYLDPSERYVLPPRAFGTLGAQLGIGESFAVSIEVRNLLDVRTTTVELPVANSRPSPVAPGDFIGYPLPGRSVWASFRADFSLAPKVRE